MKIPKLIKQTQTLFLKNNINVIQTRSNLYLLRTLQIINKINGLYKKGGKLKILDLGCGYGFNTCILKSMCPKCNIFGIDYGTDSKKSWNIINKNGYNIEFVRADARELPFEKDTFDIVISWGLLEHIGEEKISYISLKEKQLEEEKCVKEVKRVLKKDGYFFLNYLPNSYSYIEFISKHYKIYSHPKKFSKWEITQLLEGNNFKMKHLSRVHFLPSLY